MTITAAILAICIPLLGWLLKKYLYDRPKLSNGEALEKEVATHDDASVNARLANNLSRLQHHKIQDSDK